jgi:dTDP-4-dehydrorhamnose 3,5-epimerase
MPVEGLEMIFTPTPLGGVFVIDLEPVRDERGFFSRAWCEEQFAARGLSTRIAQINTAHNPHARTLRGMHFQRAPHAEVKIVSCPYGAVFDVAVDLRPGSVTYCHWFGIELTQDNHRALYIPEGLAHGYITLADNSGLTYLTSHRYEGKSAGGVRYDDPAFGIQWPVKPSLVSAADSHWPDYTRH